MRKLEERLRLFDFMGIVSWHFQTKLDYGSGCGVNFHMKSLLLAEGR